MTLVEREAETASGDNDAAELAALARAARAGRPGAFDQLAERVSRRILAFARQTTPGLAEDVLQESLVRIYRYLPSYAGGSFLAWSLTIANRVGNDLARRERRQSPPAATDHAHLVDPTEASDVRAVVQQALGELPPPLRVAFVLRQQGLTYADVAHVLGVPVGTVRSRLFEARRLLRQKLAVALEWRTEP